MAENKDEKQVAGEDIAEREKEILSFWNEHRIFEKSEEKSAPNGEFVFYDGPPFATGLPHYGHILAGTIKDAIPRYRTMRGFRVCRRWGWDCHGLPLENETEKELGLQTRRDIEKLGVGKFNEAAEGAVLRYADDWKKIVPRLGRWVDMERDYRTMDASYTESVWWIFKELYDKHLIYKGFKSMHLCPRCGTTLSNFEVNLGYKDVEDLAVTVKLPLRGEKDTYVLVWTTTAWTLPGNMAAAVNRDAEYVKIQSVKSKHPNDNATLKNGETYVLAKAALSRIVGGAPYEVLEEFRGERLLGKRYVPPFGYYQDAELEGKENAWKVYHAPYVSLEEGTGAVHLAPAFGEDDMELAQREGIPLVHHVDEEGKFTQQVKDFAGKPAKPKDNPQQADADIARYLKDKGLLFKAEQVVHSYPFCWRCETPLLNYAASSWFVKVSAVRDRLVSENKKISWVPQEIGENRFGNWLENARDWAISRSRYWGAPLPVWRQEHSDEFTVVGSVDELKDLTKRSGNTYLLMRHGEAELNTKGVLNAKRATANPLTGHGREQVHAVARRSAHAGVDMIVHSPLQRARETADILAEAWGLSGESIMEDERLREVEFGAFEGKTIEGYHSFFAFARERMIKRPEGGETWSEVKRRAAELLYEFERTCAGKTVIFISHNGTLQMLQAGAKGYDIEECAQCIADERFDIAMGEVRGLSFVPLPHNEDYELDLHRPYIDEVALVDRDGAKLARVPEVFDCWFESGSMPYGQYHYPFENTEVFDPKGGWFTKPKGYPADFIAEGMDQTRGWFYSLLVLGTALFGHSPYRNVIVSGLVLAEDGQKMSKRLKNYPDPMDVVARHGADALRYYLLSSSVVRGEDLRFSEQGVAEVARKVTTRLSHVLSFYNLYRPRTDRAMAGAGDVPRSAHVLDRWILARLRELIARTTQALERYELDRATRPIAYFIDDLSTWYIRRSRDRFKGEHTDTEAALSTTRYVLHTLSKVMAPFTPFYAERLYQEVKGAVDEESVHLSSWPTSRMPEGEDTPLLENMERVRTVVSLALEARADAGIKVRQPLRTLVLKDDALKGREQLLRLVKEEVNVKEVSFDPIIEKEVMLDTTLTKELREEGMFRELVRAVQDLRKRTGLHPSDHAALTVAASAEARVFVEKHKDALRETTSLTEVRFADGGSSEVRVGDYTLSLSLERT